MNRYGLLHIPKSNYAYAVNENTLCIRFRCGKDVNEINLIYGDKFDLDNMKTVSMKKILTDELYDYYSSYISVKHNRYVYYFELKSKDEKIYFGEYGVMETLDKNKLYFNVFQFPYLHENEVHYIPNWARDRVFYEIFPDRFFKSEKLKSNCIFDKWGKLPNRKSLYGGNLLGIVEKLDYLQELGINAIYLTPIFKSPSNHKYDTQDYYEIDEKFGTKEHLKKLVEEAHKRDIKIILDCVFNHCGYEFKYFQDVLEKGKESKYFNWFHIKGNKINKKRDNYLTFGFTSIMPKLNTINPEVRDFLINVAIYWTKEFNIDGWRLDVSDEVDEGFWREFRLKLKNINSNILILGENWHDAYPFLKGDQQDGVMNYAVTKACIEFFGERIIDSQEFSNTLSKILMRNKDFINYSMLNLLDSHDTPRFINYCKDIDVLKIALMFLITFIGMPCIYYGTEILMEGKGDPDCRRTFNWNKSTWNIEFLEYLKKLIDIRKNMESLKHGEIKIYSKDDLFIMERFTKNEKIIVVINNSNESKKFEYKCIEAEDVLKTQKITVKDNCINEKIEKYQGKILKLVL